MFVGAVAAMFQAGGGSRLEKANTATSTLKRGNKNKDRNSGLEDAAALSDAEQLFRAIEFGDESTARDLITRSPVDIFFSRYTI